MYSNLGCL